MKVLFCGPPEGSLGDLFKKVDTVNRKSGPFDVLFCVGQFFGEADGAGLPAVWHYVGLCLVPT